MTELFLREMAQWYDPQCWDCIGPKQLTDAFQRTPASQKVEPEWYTLLPTSWIPGTWNDFHNMVGDPRQHPRLVRTLDNAVSVHFFTSGWNIGASHNDQVSIGSKVRIARCPVTKCSAQGSARQQWKQGLEVEEHSFASTGPGDSCPSDHPFPYTGEGIDRGFCCHSQLDCEGGALLPSSICCAGHAYVQCASPPCHRGMEGEGEGEGLQPSAKQSRIYI